MGLYFQSLREAKGRLHTSNVMRMRANAVAGDGIVTTERIEPRRALKTAGRVEHLQNQGDLYKHVAIDIRGKPPKKVNTTTR